MRFIQYQKLNECVKLIDLKHFGNYQCLFCFRTNVSEWFDEPGTSVQETMETCKSTDRLTQFTQGELLS